MPLLSGERELAAVVDSIARAGPQSGRINRAKVVYWRRAYNFAH